MDLLFRGQLDARCHLSPQPVCELAGAASVRDRRPAGNASGRLVLRKGTIANDLVRLGGAWSLPSRASRRSRSLLVSCPLGSDHRISRRCRPHFLYVPPINSVAIRSPDCSRRGRSHIALVLGAFSGPEFEPALSESIH